MNREKLVAAGLIIAVGMLLFAGCLGGEKGNLMDNESDNLTENYSENASENETNNVTHNESENITGEVIVSADKGEYGLNETITITVENSLNKDITLARGYTCNSGQTPEIHKKVDDSWENVGSIASVCVYQPPKKIKKSESRTWKWKLNDVILPSKRGKGSYRAVINYKLEGVGGIEESNSGFKVTGEGNVTSKEEWEVKSELVEEYKPGICFGIPSPLPPEEELEEVLEKNQALSEYIENRFNSSEAGEVYTKIQQFNHIDLKEAEEGYSFVLEDGNCCEIITYTGEVEITGGEVENISTTDKTERSVPC